MQLPKDAPRPANRLPLNLKSEGTSINSALADSVVVTVGGALGVSPGVVVTSLLMAIGTKQHIGELQKDGAPPESVCVVARTKHLLEGYISQLQAAGFGTYEIKRNAAKQRNRPGVRLATMHRVKGLEFEHVIVVAANYGILPLDAAVGDAEDAVAKRNSETGKRSLLYVALTRARQSATITGYGLASPFLTTAH
jgi:superfamily I DNA/RNA helicase